MLLRNLNPVVGLCNGTRLVVRKLGRRVLECEIMGGSFAGRIHLIPRITLTNDEFGFKLSRKQFPVRLAFGMTINKSQGQSLNYVGLDLRSPAFSHGQLYVAMSRVTNVANLSVLTNADGKTTNVVYPEVLECIGD